MSATAIRNYALIVESSPEALVQTVTKALADGFQPLGGVSMLREPGSPASPKAPRTVYGQAMIRLWAPGEKILVNGGR